MPQLKTPPPSRDVTRRCPKCYQLLAHYGCSGTKKGCREPQIIRAQLSRTERLTDPAYQQEVERITQQRLRREVIRCIQDMLLAKVAGQTPVTAPSPAEAKARAECVQTLTLLVAKAQTQTEFLAGATEAWQAFRSKAGGVRQGKPSKWKGIGDALAEWFIHNNHDGGVTDANHFAPMPSHGLTQRPSDYRLIQHIHALLPDLDRDTIRKYVKLWRIVHTPLPLRTEAEWRWLAKHDCDEVKAVQALLTQHEHEPHMIHPQLENVQEIAARIIRALRPR